MVTHLLHQERLSPLSQTILVYFYCTSKLPATWPNNSLSINCSGIAAQLISTNAPFLSPCRARANSSFRFRLALQLTPCHAALLRELCSVLLIAYSHLAWWSGSNNPQFQMEYQGLECSYTSVYMPQLLGHPCPKTAYLEVHSGVSVSLARGR